MFSLTTSGTFDQTQAWLNKLSTFDATAVLEASAQAGVAALSDATPVETGLAAASWAYTIEGGPGEATITWTNSDIENGFPVVISLQYGHGTGTGGYVQGRDFINPAMASIFDKIALDVWKAVTSS